MQMLHAFVYIGVFGGSLGGVARRQLPLRWALSASHQLVSAAKS